MGFAWNRRLFIMIIIIIIFSFSKLLEKFFYIITVR